MKKYIIELYARNVVNNEEIDAYISHINYRNDAILKWLQKKLRKYIIENGEAKQVSYNESMPDWAKKANEGDLYEAVITQELTDQVNEIVDYFNSVLTEDTTFDIQKINWEAAVKNSKEFHEEKRRIKSEHPAAFPLELLYRL